MATDEILVDLAQELGETNGTMRQFIATQREANQLLAKNVEELAKRVGAIENFKTRLTAWVAGSTIAGSTLTGSIMKFFSDGGSNHAPHG